jgi:hypothetical protein
MMLPSGIGFDIFTTRQPASCCLASARSDLPRRSLTLAQDLLEVGGLVRADGHAPQREVPFHRQLLRGLRLHARVLRKRRQHQDRASQYHSGQCPHRHPSLGQEQPSKPSYRLKDSRRTGLLPANEHGHDSLRQQHPALVRP